MSKTGVTGPFAPLAGPAAAVEELARRLEPPATGWLRAAREMRGVTQQALAVKLGCKRQAWAQLEQSEARGAISLHSLRRAADALGCDLVYALVPRATGAAPEPSAAVPGATVGNTPAPDAVSALGTDGAEELPTELR